MGNKEDRWRKRNREIGNRMMVAHPDARWERQGVHHRSQQSLVFGEEIDGWLLPRLLVYRYVLLYEREGEIRFDQGGKSARVSVFVFTWHDVRAEQNCLQSVFLFVCLFRCCFRELENNSCMSFCPGPLQRAPTFH